MSMLFGYSRGAIFGLRTKTGYASPPYLLRKPSFPTLAPGDLGPTGNDRHYRQYGIRSNLAEIIRQAVPG